MCKIGQKWHLAAACRVAEWTKAGAGGAVVMGSNPAQPMNYKISEFFGRLVTSTPGTKFTVLVLCRYYSTYSKYKW